MERRLFTLSGPLSDLRRLRGGSVGQGGVGLLEGPDGGFGLQATSATAGADLSLRFDDNVPTLNETPVS